MTRRYAWLLVLVAGCARASAASDACETVTFEDARFTVCTFDPRRDELRLALRDRDGGVLGGFAKLERALGADARRVRFAMNAGMYEASGEAVGLLVQQGAETHAIATGEGAGNFYLQPNGVFAVSRDGAVSVEPTMSYARRAHPDVAWATQSGPMLVIDGALHPKLAPDGESRKVRNGVGVRDGRAVFAISDGEVSFGRFARLFRDRLHCANALFLDGTVSSAWIPTAKRRDAAHALGPLVVVLARAGS